MDEETREYIEDGKLIMLDDRIDKKEALMCLEDFEEEETAKCVWCGDEFPVDELHREKDMGYLCDNCKRGIESRGEDLEFEDEYDESLNKEKKDDKIKIKIEVIVSNDLDEKIVSGNPEDKYDEQTLEDWYDFASNVEGLIDQKFFVNNISLSKQPESLSEYIDFYRKDEEGNRKEGIVDLRLSDHGATTNARRNRINKVKKIDPNYKLVSVIVNERQFDSYDEALEYVKKLLNDLNK